MVSLSTSSSHYFSTMKGLQSMQEACVMATNLAPQCARACNKSLTKLKQKPTAEMCNSLPVAFQTECNQRVAGSIVWTSGASHLAVGAAAILTASLALF